MRVGVGFAFIYPATSAYLNPNDWIDFFPSFLTAQVPPQTLLLVWGAFEIVIALWILSGKKIFIPSALAALALLGVVFFNLSVFDIVFRDLAIACMAAALAFDEWRGRYT